MRFGVLLVAVLIAAGCTTGSRERVVTPHQPATFRSTTATPPASSQPVRPHRTYFRVVAATRVGARTVFMIANRGCAICSLVFRSTDAGASWSKLARIRPGGDVTYSIAFADPQHGWLIRIVPRPAHRELLQTDDGGRHWRRLPISRPTAVAAVNGYGYLLAGGELYAAAPGAAAFTAIGPSNANALVVSNRVALAYQNYSPVNRATRFEVLHGTDRDNRRLPCGRFHSAQAIAALSAEHLVAVCAGEPGAGEQLKHAYESADGGVTWHSISQPPTPGYVSGAAASASRAFFTGGRSPLLQARVHGLWRVAVAGSGDAGGMWGVGFTDAEHGWVVDGGPPPALYLTDNGGRTWRMAAQP